MLYIRMKTVFALLGFLVVAAYTEKVCQKEKKSIYYVYNTNVNISTYYCFINVGDGFQCGNFNNAIKVITIPPDIFGRCTKEGAQLGGNGLKKHTLCQLSAYANLLENTVTFANNMTCKYSMGYCKDTNLSKNVYWMQKDICQDLPIIHKNIFNVWSLLQNQTKSIQNEHMSLLLNIKFQFCGVEMWKTDHEDIIVSELNATTLESQFDDELMSIPPKECNTTKENKPKTWYVYEYPTTTAVYFCLMASKNSCEDMGFGETVSASNSTLLDRCSYIPCRSSACTNQKPNITLCKKTMYIDYEKDQVKGLSPNCKYSDGLCESSKTFWNFHDRCHNIQKVYEGYEGDCENTKCVLRMNGYTKFILNRKRKLCGEEVWYRFLEDGMVASENPMFTSPDVDLQNEPRNNFSRIGKRDPHLTNILVYENYFLGIPLLICFIWVAFKIGVCLVYLCLKCKTKPAVTNNMEMSRM